MVIDKLTENVELEICTAGILFILKKIFLGKRAKAFYNAVWQTIQIFGFFILTIINMFLVSKSKMSRMVKLGMYVALFLGLALFIHFTRRGKKREEAWI